MDFRHKQEVVREINALMEIKQIHPEQLRSWMDEQQTIYNADISTLKDFLDYLRVL